MVRVLTVAALLSLAACGGQSNEQALQEAANQSDPAAAAVLNEAAEAGLDPQNALEQAGQAQATQAGTNEVQPDSGVQARPNLPQSPNRPDGKQPPQKADSTPQ
jgi:hypothetical protein